MEIMNQSTQAFSFVSVAFYFHYQEENCERFSVARHACWIIICNSQHFLCHASCEKRWHFTWACPTRANFFMRQVAHVKQNLHVYNSAFKPTCTDQTLDVHIQSVLLIERTLPMFHNQLSLAKNYGATC